MVAGMALTGEWYGSRTPGSWLVVVGQRGGRVLSPELVADRWESADAGDRSGCVHCR